MEVVDAEGNSIYSCHEILARWKSNYRDLFNLENNEHFDTEHYENILQQLRDISNFLIMT